MPQLANSTIKSQRDPSFSFRGQEVVYRQKADSPSLKTGTVTESDTNTPLGDPDVASTGPGVLVGDLDQKTIRDSGGKYKVGDKRFQIRTSDLPSGDDPPKLTSQIIYNSKTYLIREYVQSGDTNVTEVLTSRT